MVPPPKPRAASEDTDEVLTDSGPAVALRDAEVGGLVCACVAPTVTARGNARASWRMRAKRGRLEGVNMRLVS
jgi:hypothetical protein